MTFRSNVPHAPTQVADLDSGRRVKVRASDVGLPSDEGMVFLEVDGSVSVL